MFIGRLIGWILVAAALAVAGRDLMGWWDTGSYQPIAAGALWAQLHPDSLQLFQPAVQRYLLPALWDQAVVPVLLAPAFLVLAVPGILFLLLFRRRRRSYY